MNQPNARPKWLIEYLENIGSLPSPELAATVIASGQVLASRDPVYTSHVFYRLIRSQIEKPDCFAEFTYALSVAFTVLADWIDGTGHSLPSVALPVNPEPSVDN